jgi:hypothetical protein
MAATAARAVKVFFIFDLRKSEAAAVRTAYSFAEYFLETPPTIELTAFYWSQNGVETRDRKKRG